MIRPYRKTDDGEEYFPKRVYRESQAVGLR